MSIYPLTPLAHQLVPVVRWSVVDYIGFARRIVDVRGLEFLHE